MNECLQLADYLASNLLFYEQSQQIKLYIHQQVIQNSARNSEQIKDLTDLNKILIMIARTLEIDVNKHMVDYSKDPLEYWNNKMF